MPATGNWARVCITCRKRFTWEGRAFPIPPCPHCNGKKPEESTPWQDALKQCDTIIELLDDVPAEGEDFADSVREKTESIRDWIERNKEVTSKQQQALDNMQAGAERWQR
jgi:hypothetical protein